MTQRKIVLRASVLAMLITQTAPAGVAGPLQIKTGNDTGSGYGFRVGNQCVVLTAAHVVETEGVLQDALLSDDRVNFETKAAEWVQSASADIARYSTSINNIPSCTETFVDPLWVESYDFGSNRNAMMISRVARTATRQMAVQVTGRTGANFVFTEARKGTVVEGFSGSVIFSNGKPFAIASSLDLKNGTFGGASLLTAFREWPTAFRTEGFRTRIALAPIMEGRRERTDLWPFAIKALQDKPNMQLTLGKDVQKACLVNVTITGMTRKSRANPAYESYRQSGCTGKKTIITTLTCPAQAPARYVYDQSIQYIVQTQKGEDAPRISTPSYSLTIGETQLSRAQIDAALFEQTVATALDEAIQEGGCR